MRNHMVISIDRENTFDEKELRTGHSHFSLFFSQITFYGNPTLIKMLK